MQSVIYIVKSNSGNDDLARSSYIPPLGVMSIANVLRAHGYNVEVIDFSVRKVDTNELCEMIECLNPLYIAFSVYTENVDSFMTMAKFFKHKYRNIPILFGGPHATVDTKYCLKKRYVDFIMVGDGEQSSLELVEAVRTKQKLIRYEDISGLIYLDIDKTFKYGKEAKHIKDLDLAPIINRDFIPQSYEAPMPTLFSSRGCPGRCIYCAAVTMSGGKYRVRDIENVFLESLFLLDKSGRTKQIFYIDDTFTVVYRRVKRFIELCDACSLKFAWRCESRVDAMIRSLDLLEGLQRSGCKRIQYGIESGNQEVLQKIQKQLNLKDAEVVIGKTIESGIRVATSFMFGHYCDTEETMEDTLSFMEMLKKKYTNNIDIAFGLNTPFPGTYQYEHMGELGMELCVDSYAQLDMLGAVVKTKNFDLDLQRVFYAKATKLLV